MKDALGHGSDGKGFKVGDMAFLRKTKPGATDANGQTRQQAIWGKIIHSDASGHVLRSSIPGVYDGAQYRVQDGDLTTEKPGGHGQPVNATNEDAARSLSSGSPKSAPAPIATEGRHGFNPEAFKGQRLSKATRGLLKGR